ncbi:MAG: class B sortase [Lachnospiraceae bacterium]|nr:class B sortase [Lachnospiraceae bacterium]
MSKAQIIILVLACCGVLGSGVMLIKTLHEYKVAESEYEDLNKFTNASAVSGIVPITPEAETEVEVVELARNYNREDFPDVDVDYQGLLEINPKTVGWLYVGAVGISYPIVQGEDNEYYLHHTFEEKENSSGAIFMDWEVKPDLTSWNTFIYGHNMKNMSMFGSLKRFIREDGLYESDPYIYVYIPGYIYRYKIFSYYLDPTDSKMYWTCDNFKEYRAYKRDALNKSVHECNTPISEDNNMVTLVTCSGSGSAKQRFFLHGEFVDRYVYE